MDCNTFSADQLFYARKSPVFDQKLKEQKLKSTTLTHLLPAFQSSDHQFPKVETI